MSATTKPYRDTIKQWPENDRPRERLLRNGTRILSDAELISAIIGTGGPKKNAVHLARELIQKAGGLDRISTLTEADCATIANRTTPIRLGSPTGCGTMTPLNPCLPSWQGT